MPPSPLLDVPGVGDLFGLAEVPTWALVTFDTFPRPIHDGRTWGWSLADVVQWAKDAGIPNFNGRARQWEIGEETNE